MSKGLVARITKDQAEQHCYDNVRPVHSNYPDFLGLYFNPLLISSLIALDLVGIRFPYR